jgi:hypothetical protein
LKKLIYILIFLAFVSCDDELYNEFNTELDLSLLHNNNIKIWQQIQYKMNGEIIYLPECADEARMIILANYFAVAAQGESECEASLQNAQLYWSIEQNSLTFTGSVFNPVETLTFEIVDLTETRLILRSQIDGDDIEFILQDVTPENNFPENSIEFHLTNNSVNGWEVLNMIPIGNFSGHLTTCHFDDYIFYFADYTGFIFRRSYHCEWDNFEVVNDNFTWQVEDSCIIYKDIDIKLYSQDTSKLWLLNKNLFMEEAELFQSESETERYSIYRTPLLKY